jgi:hypothetical protein
MVAVPAIAAILLIASIAQAQPLRWSHDPPVLTGRHHHAVIVDQAGRRLVQFGGQGNPNREVFGDVWTLSLDEPDEWRNLAIEGPGPGARLGHSATYDPVRKRMIVVGGGAVASLWGDPFQLSGDVWALELEGPARWTNLTPRGIQPHVRFGHTAVLDRRRDRLVIHGGGFRSTSSGNYEATDDTWALDLSGAGGWQLLRTTGTPPDSCFYYSPCVGQVGVLDARDDRLIVYGGGGVIAELSLATLEWTQPEVGGIPPARSYAGAVFDSARRRMLLFGGAVGYNQYRGDLVAYSPDTHEWRPVGTTGPAPTPRGHPGFVRDGDTGHCYVTGGLLLEGQYGQLQHDSATWRLDNGTPPGWRLVAGDVPQPQPAPWDHHLVFDPHTNRFILIKPDAEAWAYSPGTHPVWEAIEATDRPTGVGRNPAAFDPDNCRVVIFGDGNRMMTVQTLSLAGQPTWRTLTPSGDRVPAGRGDNGLVWDPDGCRLILHGGIRAGAGMADIWSLTLSGETSWQPIYTPSDQEPTFRGSPRALVYLPTTDDLALCTPQVVAEFDLVSGTGWRMNRLSGISPTQVQGPAFHDIPGNRILVPRFESSVWAVTDLPSYAWEQLPVEGTPPAGMYYSGKRGTLDPLGNRIAWLVERDMHYLELGPPPWSEASLATFTASWDDGVATFDWRIDAPGPVLARLEREGEDGQPVPVGEPVLMSSAEGRRIDDVAPEAGATYHLALARSDGGVRALGSVVLGARPGPEEPFLNVDLPEPVGGATRLRGELGREGRLRIRIHDVGGRLVRQLLDEARPRGRFEASWDGRSDGGARVAGGLYFVTIRFGGEGVVRRVVLLR